MINDALDTWGFDLLIKNGRERRAYANDPAWQPAMAETKDKLLVNLSEYYTEALRKVAKKRGYSEQEMERISVSFDTGNWDLGGKFYVKLGLPLDMRETIESMSKHHVTYALGVEAHGWGSAHASKLLNLIKVIDGTLARDLPATEIKGPEILQQTYDELHDRWMKENYKDSGLRNLLR